MVHHLNLQPSPYKCYTVKGKFCVYKYIKRFATLPCIFVPIFLFCRKAVGKKETTSLMVYHQLR